MYLGVRVFWDYIVGGEGGCIGTMEKKMETTMRVFRGFKVFSV